MLYSVEDLLSKDNSMSAMVLIVFQIGMTELHYRISVYWPMLQNIVDRKVRRSAEFSSAFHC